MRRVFSTRLTIEEGTSLKRLKWSVAAIAALALQLTLSGCWFNNGSENKVVSEKSGKTKTVKVIPAANSKDYRTIKPSANDTARGYIQYGVKNLVDSDQMESGLMNLSKTVFSPDQYVFQNRHTLNEKMINSILYRKGQEKKNNDSQTDNLAGLNPPLGKGKDAVAKAKNSPKYMNYVLEQDYLKENKSGKYALGGVSIAVSLNSVYTDSIMDNKKLIHDISVPLKSSTVKAWGKAHAPEILKRIRSVSSLKNVPILLTLYKTADPNSAIPGDFFASTYVDAGSSTIGKWESINDAHALFPSTAASAKYKADSEKFNNFKEDVQNYYPDYIDIIGKGYYHNNQLKDLTLTINMNKFRDQTEIIGFSDYVASIVNNRFGFSRDIPVHIYITTGSVQEALIERTSDMDKAYVSIYKP
jgi:protein involved in sex pheromone biosynthesis